LNGHIHRWIALLFILCGTLSSRAVITNFFEGFEAGLANWIVGDGDPLGPPAYWNITDAAFGGEGTHSGNFKGYCAANGFAGTTTGPLYQNNMRAYLTRTLILSGQTNATLTFWYRMPGVEAGFDFARVLIGTTELWNSDQPRTAWTLVSLSLEPFLGTTQALTFEFTSDSSVTEEGWYLDDITVTDAATPVPPPANDAFAGAQGIVGSVGSVGSSNRGATSEGSEPDAGNSIWFRWTPYTNGPVTFRTGGSAIDTLLCVYTGNTLASLVRVGCDDNGDTNGGSLISFNAVVGTAYSISVRGAGGASGFVLLSWEQIDGLGAPRLPDLTVWADEDSDYLYGWYLDEAEPLMPDRVLLRVSTATPNTGAGPLELRGSSTTPGVDQRIFRADGSFYDRFAGSFTFHPGHGHLHFDNWIHLHLRAVEPGNDVGDIIASGDKTSFAIIDLVHYDPDLPGSPNSIQYGGGLVQGLSVGWADVYSANLPDQWIDITDVPSGQYWLEAVVDPENSILESNETNNATRILIDLVKPSTEQPANDHFTNATVLAGSTAADFLSNRGATVETNEPSHVAPHPPAHSVWWRWTAPANMNVVISTDGSSFNTVLAVYRGESLEAPVPVAADDDTGAGNNSRVSFAASAGTNYYLVVDGAGGARGDVQLHFNPAFNDGFGNSLTITGLTGVVMGSTRTATRQTGEPAHAGVTGAGSIWYSWRAPLDGPVTFETTGSSFDTLLGIYTGSTLGGLNLVGADNNSAGNGASRVTFNAVNNTLYRVAVDGAGDEGVVRLSWMGPMAPLIISSPSSTNVPAGANASFRVNVTGTPPLGYQWWHHGTNLQDGSYVSGANSAVLSLHKIQMAHAGAYRVVVTNAYGAVASAPANLIVLDNPRVLFVPETFGHAGAFVRVPVELQAIGDEHAVAFSLQFDPAQLSNPRVTNVAAGAALAIDTNELATGSIGASLTAPPRATFGTGHVTLAEFIFVTAPGHATIETFAGFGTSPVTRSVRDTNDLVLPALFVPGVIELSPLRIASSVFSNGTFRLSFPAGGHHGAGERYVVDASEDLVNWAPVGTNSAVNGFFEFIAPFVLPHRFYRVRLE
jgi:hypothetical protein